MPLDSVHFGPGSGMFWMLCPKDVHWSEFGLRIVQIQQVYSFFFQALSTSEHLFVILCLQRSSRSGGTK